MVFVPWERYGICKRHALPRTKCKNSNCPLRHPSEEELRWLWDAHDESKSLWRETEHSGRDRWPGRVNEGAVPIDGSDTESREAFLPPDPRELSAAREDYRFRAPGEGMRSAVHTTEYPSSSSSPFETVPRGLDSYRPRAPVKEVDQHFDPAQSSNEFINGAMTYRFAWGKPLCVRCGAEGHLPVNCSGTALSAAEQSFLYQLMRAEQDRSKREDPKPDALKTRLDPLEREASTELQELRPREMLAPQVTGRPERPCSPVLQEASRPTYWQRYRERKEQNALLQSTRERGERQQHLDDFMDGNWDELPLSFAPRKPGKVDVARREEMERSVKVKVEADAAALAPGFASNFIHPARAALLSRPSPSAAAWPSTTASVPRGTANTAIMGATKRMSNGEAKIVGPHPSTIRVSASYITQAAIDKRLASEGLDAQERSLAEAREDTVRLQGVAWLDNVRRALQLPVKTFTTAVVYYHKFRLAHPKEDYQWVDAAAASLLTSCKNEDTLKKSRDILAAAYNMKQPNAHEQVGADDPMFEAQSRMVIGMERLILESGGFDFRSRAPHHTLVKIGKSLPQSPDLREVSQLAWTVLTDLHRTFAPLKQTSSTLALASLELAAHFTAAKSEDHTCLVRDSLQNLDLRKWHTTREEVMETLLDGLDLYTHNTTSTVLGTKYSLDDLLRIRLALNKECSDSSLPRYTVIQPPPSPDNTNGTSNTLRVANGHPTPVSPPQPGVQAPQPVNAYTATAQHTPQTDGTLRFMLNPQRATEERTEVNRYYTEEWEEYEEEIEVPLPYDRSRDRDRDRDGDFFARRDRDRDRDGMRPRDFDTRRVMDDRNGFDRRGARDSPRTAAPAREARPPRQNTANMLQSVVRAPSPAPEILAEKSEDKDNQRDAERPRARSRDRDRSYDDRRHNDRDRYDSRRDRDGRDAGGSRRYYDDDRRRDRR
ncbi:unnamed protein product [Cercospora beticola]|nr:unnamed protein product [Cercospora beticola]